MTPAEVLDAIEARAAAAAECSRASRGVCAVCAAPAADVPLLLAVARAAMELREALPQSFVSVPVASLDAALAGLVKP